MKSNLLTLRKGFLFTTTLLLMLWNPLNAQHYTIQFAPGGIATTIDSVFVENLTSGSTVTLSGTEVLKLNYLITGLPQLTVTSDLMVYPTPSLNGNCVLSLYSSSPQNAHVRLLDGSGRLIHAQPFFFTERI